MPKPPDKKNPIVTDLTDAVRIVLHNCGGRSCKSMDDLAAGAVGHIIKVMPVSRRKKQVVTPDGKEEYVETTPTGLPICNWFVSFEQPRAVWQVVRQMETMFPGYGFFVEDRVKAPIMRLQDCPPLGEVITAAMARVKAVAVRPDRVALHRSRVIAMVNCKHLPCVTAQSKTRLPSVDNLLFAFESMDAVASFIREVKAAYNNKIDLCVLVVYMPPSRPIALPSKSTARKQGGGGYGKVGWLKRMKIWGKEGPQEIAFAAVS